MALNIEIFIGLFIVYILLIPGFWFVYFVEIKYSKKNTKESYFFKKKKTSVTLISLKTWTDSSYIPKYSAAFTYDQVHSSQSNQVGRRVSRKYALWQIVNGTKKPKIFPHL